MHQVSEIMELIEALFARADKESSIFTFSFMKRAVHKRRRKFGRGEESNFIRKEVKDCRNGGGGVK